MRNGLTRENTGWRDCGFDRAMTASLNFPCSLALSHRQESMKEGKGNSLLPPISLCLPSIWPWTMRDQRAKGSCHMNANNRLQLSPIRTLFRRIKLCPLQYACSLPAREQAKWREQIRENSHHSREIGLGNDESNCKTHHDIPTPFYGKVGPWRHFLSVISADGCYGKTQEVTLEDVS